MDRKHLTITAWSDLGKSKRKIVERLYELDPVTRVNPPATITARILVEDTGLKDAALTWNMRALTSRGLVEKRIVGRKRGYVLTEEGKRHIIAFEKEWEARREQRRQRSDPLQIVDVPDMLEELGIEFARESNTDDLMYFCPFCPSDNSYQPSLSVSPHNTQWICFGGCDPGKGNGTTLVANLKDISNSEALAWIRDFIQDHR